MCSRVARSVESQGQAQGSVDVLHLVEAHMPDEIAEALGRDSSRLFDEDLGGFGSDGDRWPKDAR